MNNSNIETMKYRAAVLAGIRTFFTGNGYTEADVPLLTPAVIPEATIELFKTRQIDPYSNSRDLFLLPSPEYYLKRLIAEGAGDIFSISRSFRNSEQTGRWHNPEFTMLEWYKTGADYFDSIKITEEFFNSILNIPVMTKQTAEGLEPPFKRMSMTEVFDEYAGFDLTKHCTGELSPDEERDELRSLAGRLGLSPSEQDSWEELFNLVFIHEIEPKLPAESPLVIYNYPSGIPALAKPAAEAGRLERWELYAGGIELANCYTEETDYDRVRSFFETEAAEKENALVPVKADFDWCSMYKNGYPSCSGTALGVDRLMMMLSGSKSLEGVILFPFSDILRELN